MKRIPHLSLSCLAIIASISIAGGAHAETSKDVAATIGAVTGQPPAMTAPTITPPKMPEMPKMPDAAKMQELKIPDMPLPQHPVPTNIAAPIAPPVVTNPTPELMEKLHIMTKPAGDASPSTKAFMETNAKMHQGMMINFTGNADVDFVKGMIPHHQGAVDMAKVLLQHGKDVEIKKFAESIIKAQNGEIEFMKKWLAKHDKK